VPFSVSVSDALELLISDVVVGVGVRSLSIDTFLTGNSGGWSVDGDGSGSGNKNCEYKSDYSGPVIRYNYLTYPNSRMEVRQSSRSPFAALAMHFPLALLALYKI